MRSTNISPVSKEAHLVVLARLLGALRLPQGEGPEGVGGEDVLPGERDDDVAVGVGSGVGPVEVALGLAVLEEVRDHDDDARVLLPRHAPELGEGVARGALRADVGPRRPEAVHEVGVDVVVALLAARRRPLLRPQPDSGVVIWGKERRGMGLNSNGPSFPPPLFMLGVPSFPPWERATC